MTRTCYHRQVYCRTRSGRFTRACSSVAEQGAHNPTVAGSNPAGPIRTDTSIASIQPYFWAERIASRTVPGILCLNPVRSFVMYVHKRSTGGFCHRVNRHTRRVADEFSPITTIFDARSCSSHRGNHFGHSRVRHNRPRHPRVVELCRLLRDLFGRKRASTPRHHRGDFDATRGNRRSPAPG